MGSAEAGLPKQGQAEITLPTGSAEAAREALRLQRHLGRHWLAALYFRQTVFLRSWKIHRRSESDHQTAGRRSDSLPLCPGCHDNRWTVRDGRRLALRCRAAGQKRDWWRDRNRVSGQRRPWNVRSAARRRRQQRQGTTCCEVFVVPTWDGSVRFEAGSLNPKGIQARS